VTLAGSFQSQIGCRADWAPGCLATLMFDADKDGVYEYSTTKIATGAYQVKVTHGLTWNENYGEGGQKECPPAAGRPR
jgi:hypothetical protein